MNNNWCVAVFLWGVMAFLHVGAQPSDYAELERVLGLRESFSRQKEARIDSLKHLLHPALKKEERFRLCKAIYEEYSTYRFDSAMHYVDCERELALELDNCDFRNHSAIHRSMLLTTSGHFSESIQNLQTVDTRTLSPELLVDYYWAYEWAYSMWAEYSDDEIYAPRYYEQEMLYQDSLIQLLPASSPKHHYWKGEWLYRKRRYAEAKECYLKALEGLSVDVRLYAMTTFGLALVAEQQRDWSGYESYLIKAAISDQVCPLKENLALQQLAFYIFQNKRDAAVARANNYLKYALEDALFYNNRLRMLEVARKFPAVVHTFQEQNELKNRRLWWSLACISLLSVGLVVALGCIYKQVRQLHRRRDALTEVNALLMQTNHTREKYVSLFMELCAAYINKLHAYQAVVKRKVMAKQVDDLLKMVHATKLSDTDAKEFFVNFDTAFLNLYPGFIPAFNALLREGEAIVPKKGELLNTELRIFALIRMGVKDSSKIATLLFYSPQTIYNYRSAVKNKAIHKETFERQVEELCLL